MQAAMVEVGPIIQMNEFNKSMFTDNSLFFYILLTKMKTIKNFNINYKIDSNSQSTRGELIDIASWLFLPFIDNNKCNHFETHSLIDGLNNQCVTCQKLKEFIIYVFEKDGEWYKFHLRNCLIKFNNESDSFQLVLSRTGKILESLISKLLGILVLKILSKRNIFQNTN